MACVVCLAVLASCSGSNAVQKTEVVSCADSTKYVNMKMNIELPLAVSGADAAMRDQLINTAAGQLFYLMNMEASASDAPVMRDTCELKDYYGLCFSALERLAKSDWDFRAEYVMSDSDLTEQEKVERLSYWPSWEIDIDVTKEYETPAYSVWLSQNYVYSGGAHGGVTGAGYLTFSKADGTLLRNIIREGSEEAMQPLIRKGLCGYFSYDGYEVTDDNLGECLFDASGIIPLPAYEPYPTADGLAFVYQQYEIAPYASGMPAFTIPFDEVRPFLSDQALELFFKTSRRSMAGKQTEADSRNDTIPIRAFAQQMYDDIFARYNADSQAYAYRNYCSTGFLELLDSLNASVKSGEIPSQEYGWGADPWINAQDYSSPEAKVIRTTILSDTTCRVDVAIRDMGNTRINKLLLLNENGQWKVDDFLNDNEDYPSFIESLRKDYE